MNEESVAAVHGVKESDMIEQLEHIEQQLFLMAGSCVKSSSFKPSSICHKSVSTSTGHFNSQSFYFLF